MLQKHQKAFRIPFAYKLAFSYLLLVVLAIAVVGILSYGIALGSLKKHTADNIGLAVQQIKDNASYKLDSVVSIANNIANDMIFQKRLTNQATEMDGVEFMEYLKSYANPLINLPVIRNRISLYVSSNQVNEMYSYVEDKDPVILGRGLDIFHVARLEGSGWYKEFKSLKRNNYWAVAGNDNLYGNISYIQKFYDLNQVLIRGRNSADLGIIQITVKIDDIFNVPNFNKLGNGSIFIVTDSRKEILYSYPEQINTTSAEYEDQGEFLTMKDRIPQLEAEIMVMVPVSLLEESARDVGKLSILASLISVLLFAVVSIVVSKYFSGKVLKIVAFIDSFQDGEFKESLNMAKDDEFSKISEAILFMSSKINRLIEEVYLTKLRKTRAELEALQAQISPHFLYNTLSSISTLGQIGQIDKMHFMVEGLANFYRLTLNRGRLFISVEKEIQQIRSYLEIEKFKYGEQLVVYYHVDPAALSCFTIKVILQPFVENALKHAMFMGRKLNIGIIAHVEGTRVLFKIIDDGAGMERKVVEKLSKGVGGSSGYGIRNVDERIKLQYGQEYGVSIFSKQGIGTVVVIEIPLSRETDNG